MAKNSGIKVINGTRLGFNNATPQGAGALTSVSNFTETVFKYQDLSVTGRGTLISVFSTSLRLYADWPVEVYVNGSPTPIANIKRLNISDMLIQTVEIRRLTSFTQGAVVLVTGFPSVVDYQEREPIFLPTLPLASGSFGGTWTASTTDFTSTVVTIPPSGTATAAIWLRSFSIERSSGSITRAQIIVNYSTGIDAYGEFFNGAPSRVTLGFVFGQPLKLAHDAYLKLTGSSELSPTTVTVSATYSGQ